MTHRTSTARRGAIRRAGAAAALAAALAGGLTTVVVGAPAAVPASPTAPGAPSVIGLEYGDTGPAVVRLQEALIRVGVGVRYGVDGYFGSATRASVKAWQNHRGLPVTGVVDRATAVSLGLASSAPAPSPPAASTPEPSTPSSSGVLANGARGRAVAELQLALINNGYVPRGGVDGIFGSATERVLQRYQRDHGLAVTGRGDAATLRSLGIGGGSSPAPNPTPAPSNPDLARGSRGPAVAELQRALMRLGIHVAGGADGIFGPATEAALKAFQRSKGLAQTGRLDSATRQALESSGPRQPANPELARGSRGPAVVELQQALMRAGIHVPGGADGIFGPATEGALKSFQRANGLAQTGRLDSATRRALASAGPRDPGSGSPYIGLRLGSRGPAVAAVQRAIARLGYYVPGGADGIYGTATQSVVMLIQRTNGITASGEIDAATARLLGLTGGNPGVPDSGGTAPGYPVYDERGARVVALQRALIAAGISVPGGADGAFGSGTAGAIIAFQRARGLPVTGKVDAATARALGLSPMPPPSREQPPATVRLEAKPVQAPCHYGDTWGYSRGGGRVHLGVDILAAHGNELYAVATGRITQIYRDRPGSLAGNGLKITRPDGTYFFYAHLSRLARGIEAGTPVRAGQLVGYVGSTGNSATPHLHLEVHPGGGSAVNPYPLVRATGAC